MTRRHWLLIALFPITFLAVGGVLIEYAAVVAKDGSILPLLVWVAVFSASFILLITQAIGISGEGRGETAFEDVVDTLPIGVALYDVAGKLRHCNETFRQAFPDPAIHGDLAAFAAEIAAPNRRQADIDCDYELASGDWMRLARRDLAGGGCAITAFDISRIMILEAELRAAGIQFRQFLSAAAEWTWETDVLHRFSMIREVDPDGSVADVNWMIGRGLAELTGGGMDANGLAAAGCMLDMERRKRLREVRLVLGAGRNMVSARLGGVPRYDGKGEFLGYAGVGMRDGSHVPPAEPISGAPEPAPHRPAGPLLLVDDSSTNRQLAKSILNRMGYVVDDVDDGPKAIEAVQIKDYSAILMDIWMPGMDGFAATAAIRALPSPRGELPIIAMTAHVGEEDRRRCLDGGMDEHIGKPIDRAMLETVLRRLAGPPPGIEAPEAGGGAPPSPPPSPPPPSSPPAGAALVSDGVLEQLRKDAGPALVTELISAYMAETDERLVRIAAAVAVGNFEDIGADAHSMKSSSGTFGALPLQVLSARLEAAAMHGDAATMAAAHDELPLLVSDTWREFALRGYRRK